LRIIIVLNILQRGDEFESGGKGAGSDHDDKDADHVILMTIILVPMACVATSKRYFRFQTRCLCIRSLLQVPVAAASKQHIGE
jgi:hypothetical protein